MSSGSVPSSLVYNLSVRPAQQSRWIHGQDRDLVQETVGVTACVELEVEVLEQRVDVALHDPHARLLEDGPGVGPAALPEQPQPVFTRVLQELGLPRLRHALPDVLATDVPAAAGRERRERQRRATMTVPAAAVEVGDGRERGHLGCCGPQCYTLSERAPEVVTGGANDWKEGGDGEHKRGREINANASFTYMHTVEGDQYECVIYTLAKTVERDQYECVNYIVTKTVEAYQHEMRDSHTHKNSRGISNMNASFTYTQAVEAYRYECVIYMLAKTVERDQYECVIYILAKTVEVYQHEMRHLHTRKKSRERSI